MDLVGDYRRYDGMSSQDSTMDLQDDIGVISPGGVGKRLGIES